MVTTKKGRIKVISKKIKKNLYEITRYSTAKEIITVYARSSEQANELTSKLLNNIDVVRKLFNLD